MTSFDYPRWIRVIDIVIGLILIGLSVYLLSDASFAETFILNFFAIGLLLIGVFRTIKGVMMEDLIGISRLTKIVLGLVIIGLGMSVLLLPGLAIPTLIMLVALGIMMAGVSRAIVGFKEKDLVNWARGLYIIAGLLVVCIGFIIILLPTFGFFVLVVMISTSFIVLGMIRILSGVTGELR